jgi:uncharacterized membrane protein
MTVQASTTPTTTGHRSAPRDKIAIQDASAYILRIGVLLSVGVMLTGLFVALVHDGATKSEMLSRTFSANWSDLGRGLRAGDGFALMELGVAILVLTPILRVATATVLFAVEEHDRLYTCVTFLVLLLTVASLLFIS